MEFGTGSFKGSDVHSRAQLEMINPVLHSHPLERGSVEGSDKIQALDYPAYAVIKVLLNGAFCGAVRLF